MTGVGVLASFLFVVAALATGVCTGACIAFLADRYFERKQKQSKLPGMLFPIEPWSPGPGDSNMFEVRSAHAKAEKGRAAFVAAGTVGGRVPRNRVDLTGRTFSIDRDVMRGEWIITATLRATKGDRTMTHAHEIVLDPEGARELRAILDARGQA